MLYIADSAYRPTEPFSADHRMGCGSSKSIREADGARPQASTSTAAPTRAPPAPSPSPVVEPVVYEDTSRRRSGQTEQSSTKAEPSGNELREAEEKPMIIFVIGGPGSGKGTQCKMIVDKYGGGFRHLSTGDLLRAETKRGSELGKKLESKMSSGGLVSDDQVIEVLEKEINESAWFGLAFLVDGFPRTVSQAKKFEERIRPSDLVLYFDCPENTMSARLTERSKTSGRSDDTPSSVKQRLKTFKKETLPVIEFFQSQGKLHRISALPSANEIFKDVEAVLDEKTGKAPDVSDAARAESSEWRVPQVIDIENKFYGSLKDEGS